MKFPYVLLEISFALQIINVQYRAESRTRAVFID